MKVTSKITGLKELNKAFDALTDVKFRKAALRNAGKDLMKPVMVEAKRLAPTLKDPAGHPNAIAGKLRDDIKMTTSVNVSPVTKSGKISKSKKNELTVTVKTGKATEDYAIVAEYGRERTTVIRNEAFGKDTKPFFGVLPELQPKPYMRPALNSNYQRIFNDFAKTMGDEIIKQAKRQKKAKK